MKNTLLLNAFIWLQLFQVAAQSNDTKSSEQLKAGLQQTTGSGRLNGLIQISYSFLESEDETESTADSAMFYAKQAEVLLQSLPNDPNTGEVYLLLAEVNGAYGDQKVGSIYGRKAVAYFEKHGPPLKLAKSYKALSGNLAWHGAELAEKIKLAELVANIYHREQDTEMEAATLKQCGKMLMYHGEMEKGREKLKQSLVLYQSIKYKQVQELYSLIGINYSETGNNVLALKYGLLAVKTAEELKDSSIATAVIYNYMAVTYEKIGPLDRVDEYLKKAYTIARRENDTSLIYTLVNNISQRLLKQDKPQEALVYLKDLVKNYPNQHFPTRYVGINSIFLKVYLQLKDYKNAAVCCAKLIAILEKSDRDDPTLLVIYPALMRYFYDTKKYARALVYIPDYQTYCERNNYTATLRSVHLSWFKLDSALGNYVSAIKHYQLYETIDDSIYNESKSKQIAELQIQYDTEKKDKNIQLLTEQDLLQKTKLEQSEFLRNVILGGVTLLVIILLLLYNRYRVKLRTNQKLEAQQKEIYTKNQSLQHLLNEKEWLLKEIHHRVKNNLQTVMSLLSSQSAYIQNDAALTAIQDSQHRVHAMSLIHQKLYSSENVSTIDMPTYIRELTEYMRDCFNTGQRIRFEMNIEPLELDVSQAVPLGLILNEAITNAIKYAFPNNRDGIIKINLEHIIENQYLLTISDNGMGFSNEKKAGSLGLSLIKGLSEDLDGTFTLEHQNGTVLKISFVHDAGIKRISTFISVDTIAT